jgi:mannose-6-phosphate isomerase-like protein (cupin superfamily)
MDRLTAAVLLLLPGFAPAADWIDVPEGGGAVQRKNLEQTMRQYPLGAGENLRVMRLGQNGRTTHLLVQIRDREPLHHHADSDSTIVMLRGEGTLHLEGQTLALRAGDSLHVPRGVVHAFANRGREPAAALVIYSPTPGPNDRVLADEPAPARPQ